MPEVSRFYTKFQPDHYDIYLDIDRSHKAFSGKTTITGTALTPQIAIHQEDMTIEAVTMNDSPLPFTTDDANTALYIDLPHAGTVTLTVTYSAKLTDKMMGIYPSYYTVDGVKKEIIGTQFETTAARQAFPCVDEPEAKATFSLAIKFDEHAGETILSNMPEKEVVNGVHYFETTVRMSTYLVAFAFGELQSKMTQTKSGVQIGVFATKAHQANELDFALDIAKNAIEFFEEFYHTPYPLPHSWQLALPDFSAGAMENWGLVTYREAYLLLDPDNTALDTKQVVATVITHELAHQWFGDLVTMKWWDELWLNESFANMMEYVAVDAIRPEWNIWELFQTSEPTLALQRDATDGVQPIHVAINDPAEIDTVFDAAIVYAKGSRMLVMVRALIGDEALRTGLKNYFAQHKYGNATGDDLWTALGEAAGIDVGAIMNSWLKQPGYPVVTAQVNAAGQLVLTQKQFFIGAGQDQGRVWQVPLNSNYESVPQIMKDRELVLGDYASLRAENGEPFRLNLDNTAHYIVHYDQQLFQDILDNVSSLDNIAQMQLLQDLLLLAKGQVISFADLIPALHLFADSHSYIVMTALSAVIAELKRFVLPDSPAEKHLKEFVNNLSVNQVARLGWQPVPGESADDELTRPIVLNAALYAENDAAIAAAHQIYTANSQTLSQLPAATRMLILRNEAQHFGNMNLVKHLLNEYVTTADSSYKQDIYAAVTQVKGEAELNHIVAQFQNSDVVKPQDLRAWFSQVLGNPNGEQLAWDWIRNNWQWLEDTVGGDMEYPTYVTVIARHFKTKERLEEFKEFFTPKLKEAILTREIQMDTNLIAGRVALIADQAPAVQTALAQALQ